MKYDAPLIITGPPRSGTTGLQLALTAMPGVCVWYECELYVTAFHPYESIVDRMRRLVLRQSGAGPFSRSEIDRRPSLFRNPLAETISITAVRRVVEQLGPDCNTQVLREALFDLAEANRGPLRLYGDKAPKTYLRCLPDVLTTFPKAKVIVTVRDGRDVAASLHGRRPERGLTFGTELWTELMRATQEVKEDPRVMLVRLEDAAKDVPAMFKRIADFAGLEITREGRDGFYQFYHPSHIGRWRVECPGIEKQAGAEFVDSLREWGYA